jgi:hypothetical protein
MVYNSIKIIDQRSEKKSTYILIRPDPTSVWPDFFQLSKLTRSNLPEHEPHLIRSITTTTDK